METTIIIIVLSVVLLTIFLVFIRQFLVTLTKQIEEDEYLEVLEFEKLSFLNWVIDNCELAEDNSFWIYNSENYTSEGLLRIYNNLKTWNKK